MRQKDKKKHIIREDPYKRFDKVVAIIVGSYWGLLLLFGVFTLIQPTWLKDTSGKGRREEAQIIIDNANNMLYKAHETNSKELFSQASSQYLLALSIDSLNADALGNLAVSYIYLNRLAEATELFDKLVKRDTACRYFAYVNLGDLYERSGDKQKALEYYLMAAQGYEDPAYLFRKAGLYFSMFEKYPEAISYLEKSIEMEESFEYLYLKTLKAAYTNALFANDTVNYDFLLKKILEKDFKKDITVFDQKIFFETHKTNKGLGFAYMYLGDVYDKLSDREKALQCYKTAADYYPPINQILAEREKNPAMPPG